MHHSVARRLIAASVACLIALSLVAVSPVVLAASAQESRPASTPVDVRGKLTTSSEKDTIDWVVTGAQILGAVVAVLTLPIIALQLFASSRATRQQLTGEVQSVWNERDFQQTYSPVYAFIEVHSVDECVLKFRSWVRATHGEQRSLLRDLSEPQVAIEQDADDPPLTCRNEVFHVLGVIENLSLRYNENEISRRWVALALGPSMVALLHQSLWLIHCLRSHFGSPTMCCEWVQMVQDLRAPPARRWPRLTRPIHDSRAIYKRLWQRRPHRVLAEVREPVDDQSVRIICLPPSPQTASDEDWTRARRLSAGLACEPAQDKLCSRAAVGERLDPAWRVIVVPKSIDADERQIATDSALSDSLNDRVAGFDSAAVDETIASLSGA